MKVNDWIADFNNNQIGKIKEIHDDEYIDVVLYARSGEKIGRESPAGSGPKSFEPCCNRKFWKVIKRPSFPLGQPYYLNEIVEAI